MSFVVGAHEVVGDWHGQRARQRDTELGAQGPMAGEAPGEVALDHDREACVEVALNLLGGGEQRGEVEAHPCFDIRPLVHRMSEWLVEGRHGGDEHGLPGRGEHGRER